MNKKTTKEILERELDVRGRVPLYNPEALEMIRKQFDAWILSTVREEDRREWLKTPRTVLGSNIPREMVYTPLSHADFDYEADLGNSERLLSPGVSIQTCTEGGNSRCAN